MAKWLIVAYLFLTLSKWKWANVEMVKSPLFCDLYQWPVTFHFHFLMWSLAGWVRISGTQTVRGSRSISRPCLRTDFQVGLFACLNWPYCLSVQTSCAINWWKEVFFSWAIGIQCQGRQGRPGQFRALQKSATAHSLQLTQLAQLWFDETKTKTRTM